MAVCGFTSLTAWSSDDSTTPIVEQEKNHLLGEWKAASTHMKLVIDGEILVDELNKESSMHGLIRQVALKEDSTVKHYTYIPASENIGDVDRHGKTTYEKNGNQLILKNYPVPYTILLLDDKNMNLHVKTEFVSDGKHYIL